MNLIFITGVLMLAFGMALSVKGDSPLGTALIGLSVPVTFFGIILLYVSTMGN